MFGRPDLTPCLQIRLGYKGLSGVSRPFHTTPAASWAAGNREKGIEGPTVECYKCHAIEQSLKKCEQSLLLETFFFPARPREHGEVLGYHWKGHNNNNNNNNNGNFICVFGCTIVNLTTYRQFTNAAWDWTIKKKKKQKTKQKEKEIKIALILDYPSSYFYNK